jgi:hypothetical protein
MKDLAVDRSNHPDAAQRDRWDSEDDEGDEDDDGGDASIIDQSAFPFTILWAGCAGFRFYLGLFLVNIHILLSPCWPCTTQIFFLSRGRFVLSFQ